MKLYKIILIGYLTIVSGNCYDRNGLHLGLGLGAGTIQASSAIFKEEKKSEAITLDTKIGYGFNNQFVINCDMPSTIFDADNKTTNKNVLLSEDMYMLGGSYFFKSTENSPYISAGYGKSKIEFDENNIITNYTGKVYKLAIGYEFKNWYVEAKYLKTEDVKSSDYESKSFLMSFGYNLYGVFGIK